MTAAPVTAGFTDVRFSVDDGVAWVQLDRLARGNALSANTYRELRDATRMAEADPSVDIIVFTGTGASFATGGDLDDVLEVIEGTDPLAIYRFIDATPFESILESEKVTVAAINGKCLAGGLMLALSCDIRIAADQVTFAIPEGCVGLADPWLPMLLASSGNQSLVRYFMFTGLPFTTAQAREMGLLAEVVPPDELIARCHGLVGELRRTTIGARQRYKQHIKTQRPRVSSESMARMVREPDVLEGLRAGWAQRERKNGSSRG